MEQSHFLEQENRRFANFEFRKALYRLWRFIIKVAGSNKIVVGSWKPRRATTKSGYFKESVIAKI
jgi:hypothetical protein